MLFDILVGTVRGGLYRDKLVITAVQFESVHVLSTKRLDYSPILVIPKLL